MIFKLIILFLLSIPPKNRPLVLFLCSALGVYFMEKTFDNRAYIYYNIYVVGSRGEPWEVPPLPALWGLLMSWLIKAHKRIQAGEDEETVLKEYGYLKMLSCRCGELITSKGQRLCKSCMNEYVKLHTNTKRRDD